MARQTLTILVVLALSMAASAVTMDFDSYADDAAWVAAGRDGWTINADAGCNLWLLAKSGNTADKFILMRDATTGGVISISNSSFGDVVDGGTISFDILDDQPIAGQALHYYIYLKDNGQNVAALSIRNYDNQMQVSTTGGAWTALVPAGGTSVWKNFKFEISNDRYNFYIDDAAPFAHALGYSTSNYLLADGIDEIVISSPLNGYRGDVCLDNINIAVPEPATMAVLGLGGIAALYRRKKLN